MSETATLIEKARDGFETLDVLVKHQIETLKWLEIWLTDDIFRDYVLQIKYLIESEKWEFLLDSFYQVIPLEPAAGGGWLVLGRTG